MTEYELVVSVPKDWYDYFEDNAKVIRCKDCKFAQLDSWYCEAWNNSPGFPIVKADGYCWMAERKETNADPQY